MSWAVTESRLPVGSSARTTAGSATRALAIATRCCWPPESWSVSFTECCASPTRSSGAGHPAIPCRRLDSVEQQRHFDVLGGRRLRKKRQTLNDETARSPAKSGAGTSPQRRPVNAGHAHVSLVGGVESAEKKEEGAFA